MLSHPCDQNFIGIAIPTILSFFSIQIRLSSSFCLNLNLSFDIVLHLFFTRVFQRVRLQIQLSSKVPQFGLQNLTHLIFVPTNPNRISGPFLHPHKLIPRTPDSSPPKPTLARPRPLPDPPSFPLRPNTGMPCIRVPLPLVSCSPPERSVGQRRSPVTCEFEIFFLPVTSLPQPNTHMLTPWQTSRLRKVHHRGVQHHR